jgi:hypothetical protein
VRIGNTENISKLTLSVYKGRAITIGREIAFHGLIYEALGEKLHIITLGS